ncbi:MULTISPECIES: transposase [unclassified Delftia]|uniref:PD-(D/E)XK nuclease domain-containing protein n=1 Tax=unclassified Delftia TaxID=2613839 RepID=UPI000806F21E|nr:MULTISPECIES: transposase [unclassified Delftia]
MTNTRLSRALCKVVGDVIQGTGGHATLDALFSSSGAPGEPPALAHHSKWKEWLFRAGQDPNSDSLQILGNVLEEYMDTRPVLQAEVESWKEARARIEAVLAEDGLRYYRHGRVLPVGRAVDIDEFGQLAARMVPAKPSTVDEVVKVVIQGLRRAMHPLTYRRKGAETMHFVNEYDVQDLLHALLRPWVVDVRAEEYTPSYAGRSTRMDFFLPAHDLVIETKCVRDRSHAKAVGDELVLDIAHYAIHPGCKKLWCVVYDPEHYLTNSAGLKDLEGDHKKSDRSVNVKVFIVHK